MDVEIDLYSIFLCLHEFKYSSVSYVILDCDCRNLIFKFVSGRRTGQTRQRTRNIFTPMQKNQLRDQGELGLGHWGNNDDNNQDNVNNLENLNNKDNLNKKGYRYIQVFPMNKKCKWSMSIYKTKLE